jgi:hypothetical protein
MKTQINGRLLLTAIFWLTGFCIFPNKLIGQQTPARKVIMGFKVSPNLSWVRMMEGNLENKGMKPSFSYGLIGDFMIARNPNYWLSGEMLISSFPVSVAATDTLYSGKKPYTNAVFNYKLQYIQLPVSLKLKTGEIGRITYWGQFGLAPSFMIRNKVTTLSNPDVYAGATNSHTPNSRANDIYDFSGSTKSFEDNVLTLRASMIMGAGIEAKISGKSSFIAGLRFDNGFTDLFWDKKADGRNNYLGLQLGILF